MRCIMVWWDMMQCRLAWHCSKMNSTSHLHSSHSHYLQVGVAEAKEGAEGIIDMASFLHSNGTHQLQLNHSSFLSIFLSFYLFLFPSFSSFFLSLHFLFHLCCLVSILTLYRILTTSHLVAPTVLLYLYQHSVPSSLHLLPRPTPTHPTAPNLL